MSGTQGPAARVARPRPELSIVLPGTWVVLPVDDEEAANREISRVIREQIGRDDRRVRLRRDLREHLRTAWRDAQGLDAALLAFALEILPGVPFSASLVADYLDWPEVPSTEDTLGAALERCFPGGEIVELGSGVATRSWRKRTIELEDGRMPDVSLAYHLVEPIDGRLLRVVADVPLDLDPLKIVELFDSMIDSVRWYREADDPEV